MADQPSAETPPPAVATDAARRPYAAPRLMLFGSAVEMTAAGSGWVCENGFESAYLEGDCKGVVQSHERDPSNAKKQRS